MMAPFDSSASGQPQQGVGPGPVQHHPMGPGQQGGQGGMHQQQMNPTFMHRQASTGMGPQGQPYMPPQPSGSRQNSFSMPNQQGHYSSSHAPLHSQTHQQQQGFNPHQQMHRSSVNSGSMSQPHMGMQPMPQQQQHNMRQTSSQRGSFSMNNPMNNSMGNSMGNGMNMNSMNNPMNNGMNAGPMNAAMGNGMGNMNNQMGMMGNGSGNSMGNPMNSQMGGPSVNSMGNSMNGPVNSSMATPMGSSMNNSMSASMNSTTNGSINGMNNANSNNAINTSMNNVNNGMNTSMNGSMNTSMNNVNNGMSSMNTSMNNVTAPPPTNNNINNANNVNVNNNNAAMANTTNSGSSNNPTSSGGGGGGGSSGGGGGGGGSGMNGSWQSDSDTPHRRQMIQRIVEMFQRERNGSREWLEKLPIMARQLEVSLYRGARSFEAYMDMSTLRRRLNQIAEEVSVKANGRSGSSTSSNNGRDRQSSFTSSGGGGGSANPANSGTGSGSPAMGLSSSNHTNQMPPNRGQAMNMDQINPMAGNGGSGGGNSSINNNGRNNKANSNMPNMNNNGGNINGGGSSSNNNNSGIGIGNNVNNVNSGSGSSNMGNNIGGSNNNNSSNMGYQNSRQQSSNSNSTSVRSSSSNNQSSSGQNRNDPEWRVRIRHKQQRLLLLHHSAKCQREDGQCTVTPLCGEMKQLWRHMEGCRDNNCVVPHCFSSRAILSHYRRCRDASCPACGPVRETVQTSNNRQRQRSAMNQMPGSSSQQRGRTGNNDPLSNGVNHQQPNSMQNVFNSNPPMSNANNMGNMNQNQGIGFPPINPMSNSTNTGSNNPASNNGNNGQMNNINSNNNTNISGSSSNNKRSMNGPQSSTNPSMNSMPPMMNGNNNNMNNNVNNANSGSNNNSNNIPNNANGNNVSGGNNHSLSGGPTDVTVPSLSGSNNAQGGGGPGSNGNSRRDDVEWQRIRHKQQRLLLLRHASRCQYPPENCPVTPHCANMKKLWDHIARCKDQRCTVAHCMSSRYVLSHYRRCRDTRCPACGPVRDTIRRSNELERKNGNGGGNNNNAGSLSIGGGLSPPLSHSQPPQNQMGNMSMPQIGSSGMPNTTSSSPDMVQQTKRMKMDHPGLSSGQMPGKGQMTNGMRQPPHQRSAATGMDAGQHSSSRVKPDGQQSSGNASKESEDHSLLNSFTIEQLTTHLASLNRAKQLPPSKLKTKCSEVLRGLQAHQHGWVFNTPVDPEELNLPDYFDVIKKPMDLGTISKRLDAGHYHAVEDFRTDVNLTFDNAMSYNETGSVVYEMADELKKKFVEDYRKMMIQLDNEDQERRKSDRACALCGCEKLLFEPPVFFCNGMNCPSKRIRRNSHFYIGGNNQYFWCNQCYNELDGNIPIELVDLTISKGELKKKKNDEQHEESWVECDKCKRWIHQICGLFNVRLNKEHHSEYCCPMCLLDERKQPNPAPPPPTPPMAADLPRTRLSEALESHVSRRIKERKRELVEEKVKNENSSMEAALRTYENSGQIIIRQVTSMDRKLEVRELMKKRYAHKKYPDEFPFRCKCIVVFQHIDGVDVILFALYVYEHGEDNPAPNQRCVYVSYLDSVHFMRPRRLRTFVYHEILIAYLDYVRQRGFATAHIWACPPLKGDDYIFYAKPEDQKTPRDNRLRQWYIDMLLECQRRSIVGTVTNMYDLYFADESLDGTAVPYLEGDYFPGEAENIIKTLEESGGKKKSSSGKSKKKSQTKAKSRGGTRSTGMDEESLLASGLMDGVKNLSDLDRDQVMVKLGETIQPMKESFIVAFLNWEGVKKEHLEVPDEIQKYRDEHPGKLVPLKSGNKRDADGKTSEEVGPVDRNGRPIKVIDDDAEDLDCEFLNNRQAFLNLCRGNHYQFDELRRAKHTSMMVLWHLHNRDAPKFVQQCVVCNREILSGKRYHCSICPDYDLCAQCYRDPKTNRGTCTHALQPIDVESEGGQDGGSNSSTLTAAQRKHRQRNLELHIQLIEHASKCVNEACPSKNCAKMKNYLRHAETCSSGVQGGCRICKRIWTLLRIHAQKCKDVACPIPQCTAIRDKMRQLQKQQQAMDDRRRLEMNRHYRKGGSISVA